MGRIVKPQKPLRLDPIIPPLSEEERNQIRGSWTRMYSPPKNLGWKTTFIRWFTYPTITKGPN